MVCLHPLWSNLGRVLDTENDSALLDAMQVAREPIRGRRGVPLSLLPAGWQGVFAFDSLQALPLVTPTRAGGRGCWSRYPARASSWASA